MPEPLAVAVVCYPNLGGSAVIAAELAVRTAQRGHTVHVVASAPPSRALPECRRLIFHRVEVPDYPLFEHPPYTLALASKIVEVAAANRIDLIHVHYALPHAISAVLARQAVGSTAPRTLVTLHGTDVTGIGIHPSYLTMTRLGVAAADAITVPSRFLRGEALKLLGPAGERPIEVIPNFVDTQRFAPAAAHDRRSIAEVFGDDDGPILFHVSNFRPLKRVADLMEVLVRIRAERPARLLIVGDGPERQKAETRARELDLTGSVRFLGKRPEFSELLAQADAFLLPSETESFGVAALEALSCGVPVFGYRVGGLPEVVTDDVGRLVEPFDVGALARAVLDTLADSTRHASMRTAARRRAVTEFHADGAVKRYEQVYRRVVAEASAPPERRH